MFILSFFGGVFFQNLQWPFAILVSCSRNQVIYLITYEAQLGIKDSGSFVPGHGGALDRFDGYLSVCR